MGGKVGRLKTGASDTTYPEIGPLLRERRAHHGWTLADVSSMTGISASTLSKIENGVISPTYDKILQLSRGLQVEIADLLTARTAQASRETLVLTRQSLSRQFDGMRLETRHYVYSYLCNEVAHKRIIPIHIEVKALDEGQMGELTAHFGEEFFTVLTGKIRFYSEYYEPVDLEVGDSLYLDSTMKHGYMSLDPKGSTVIVTCSSATPNLAQTLREVIKAKIIEEAGHFE
ncbi:XRE family transcriptional regulator [Mesorhizobium argentiipisi]|uniref:XRE family transcriptional regulator n=1 Tax=Mesorhizobium argentiipisi TaxID=3015175 RepID=A0ABU8KAR9_9HYPH